MRCALVLFGLLALAGCSREGTAPTSRPNHAAEPEQRQLSIAGIPRRYLIYTPSSLDRSHKVPLVMLLHGATDDALYAYRAYHLPEKAAREGFIAVFPEALGDRRAWDAFGDPAHNADLDFLVAILDGLPGELPIDPDRIYICGHSAGAMMTFLLAATHGDRLAAIGAVAGTVGYHQPNGPAMELPAPKHPIPVILFHGQKDPNVPYAAEPADDRPTAYPVTRTVAFFLQANGGEADEKLSEPVPNQVLRAAFTTPAGSRGDVVLYTLVNGNHMWPGGVAMPGKNQRPSREVSATDLLWDFFKAHRRQGT